MARYSRMMGDTLNPRSLPTRGRFKPESAGGPPHARFGLGKENLRRVVDILTDTSTKRQRVDPFARLHSNSKPTLAEPVLPSVT